MIRRIIVVAGLAIVLALPAFGQNMQRFGKVEAKGWSQISIVKDQITLTGPRVYIRTVDGQFAAKATKIIITTATAKKTAGGNLQHATLTGNAWVLMKPTPGQVTEASADSINVDWANKQEATLTGNVHMTSTDPSMWQGPTDIVFDTAIVNLKPESQMKPGESRIMIQGDPSKTKLEFTPLPKADKAGKPTVTEQK